MRSSYSASSLPVLRQSTADARRVRPGPNSSTARLVALDGRTKAARFLRQVSAELVAQLGASATPGQRLIARNAAVKALRLHWLEARLVAAGDVPTEVEDRFLRWSTSLRHDLDALGIGDRVVRMPRLAALLASGGAA